MNREFKKENIDFGWNMDQMMIGVKENKKSIFQEP